MFRVFYESYWVQSITPYFIIILFETDLKLWRDSALQILRLPFCPAERVYKALPFRGLTNMSLT